jgi:hypothetical protein
MIGLAGIYMPYILQTAGSNVSEILEASLSASSQIHNHKYDLRLSYLSQFNCHNHSTLSSTFKQRMKLLLRCCAS